MERGVFLIKVVVDFTLNNTDKVFSRGGNSFTSFERSSVCLAGLHF